MGRASHELMRLRYKRGWVAGRRWGRPSRTQAVGKRKLILAGEIPVGPLLRPHRTGHSLFGNNAAYVSTMLTRPWT